MHIREELRYSIVSRKCLGELDLGTGGGGVTNRDTDLDENRGYYTKKVGVVSRDEVVHNTIRTVGGIYSHDSPRGTSITGVYISAVRNGTSTASNDFF